MGDGRGKGRGIVPIGGAMGLTAGAAEEASSEAGRSEAEVAGGGRGEAETVGGADAVGASTGAGLETAGAGGR